MSPGAGVSPGGASLFSSTDMVISSMVQVSPISWDAGAQTMLGSWVPQDSQVSAAFPSYSTSP